MRLENWKIGTRLLALAGVMATSTLVVGTTGWLALNVEARHMEATQTRARAYGQAIDLSRSAQVHFKTQIQEWKNILLRGGERQAFEKYRKAFAEEGRTVKAKLGELEHVLQSLGMPVEDVDEAREAIETLSAQYTQALAGYDPAQPDASAHAVDEMVKGLDRPPTQKIEGIVARVREAAKASEAASLAATQATGRAAMAWMVGAILAALAIGSALSWLIYRSITGPLQEAVDAASRVAQGHLNVKLDVRGDNEISQLRAAMARMNDSLLQVVSQVRQSADSVTHATNEIATGNMDLSARTETHASSLQQTAATITQLSHGGG